MCFFRFPALAFASETIWGSSADCRSYYGLQWIVKMTPKHTSDGRSATVNVTLSFICYCEGKNRVTHSRKWKDWSSSCRGTTAAVFQVDGTRREAWHQHRSWWEKFTRAHTHTSNTLKKHQIIWPVSDDETQEVRVWTHDEFPVGDIRTWRDGHDIHCYMTEGKS